MLMFCGCIIWHEHSSCLVYEYEYVFQWAPFHLIVFHFNQQCCTYFKYISHRPTFFISIYCCREACIINFASPLLVNE